MGHSIRLTWVRTGQQLLCTQRVPAMLRVVSVSLCKTLGLLAVATGCGHLSGLLGPPLCTSGAPPLLLVFPLGICRSSRLPVPPFASPACAATTHQCHLGVLAAQGPWNDVEPLLLWPEFLCPVGVVGSSSQVPLELPLLPDLIRPPPHLILQLGPSVYPPGGVGGSAPGSGTMHPVAPQLHEEPQERETGFYSCPCPSPGGQTAHHQGPHV